MATPHVEMQTAASRTSSYQIGRIAVVANAGTMVRLGPAASVLAEYRMSRATLRRDWRAMDHCRWFLGPITVTWVLCSSPEMAAVTPCRD